MIIKHHAKNVMVASKNGAEETRCFAMFTIDQLPDRVLCVTKVVYMKGSKGMPVAYALTDYASGYKMGPDMDSPSVDLAIGQAVHLVAEHGAEKVLRLAEAAPVLNFDAEDFLL